MTHVLQTLSIVACLAFLPSHVAAEVDRDGPVDYGLIGWIAPEGQAGKLIVYSADWCVPCQRLKPALKRLKAAGYQVKIVDVDRDETPLKYSVVPTLFYLRAGEVVKTQTGAQPKDKILEVLWKLPSSQD